MSAETDMSETLEVYLIICYLPDYSFKQLVANRQQGNTIVSEGWPVLYACLLAAF